MTRALLAKVATDFTTFTVAPDYAKTLFEMIKAGNYTYVNEHIIAENFPSETEEMEDMEIILVHFNRSITSEAAFKEIDERGLRPAVLQMLLAFGEMYQAVQKEFPIVALGSIWRSPDGARRVPCLDGWTAGRELRLNDIDDGWRSGYRFAAVCK